MDRVTKHRLSAVTMLSVNQTRRKSTCIKSSWAGNKKIWKSKNFFTQISIWKWFTNGIHSFLMRADARGSDDIILAVCSAKAYRYFAGQALLIMSQSRSRMEYLSPTNTSIVL